MKEFWERFKKNAAVWMQGRYGMDALGKLLIYGALILYLVMAILGIGLLRLLALAAFAWGIYRILSRNHDARRRENDAYLKFRDSWLTKAKQAYARLKGSKQYRYFTCPKCHKRLRLPRGVGTVTVHCKQCGHSFDKKA